MRADRIRELRVRARVGAVRARGNVGRELLEERFGSRRHREFIKGVPCEKRIVKLLRNGEGRDVPRLFERKGESSNNVRDGHISLGKRTFPPK